MTRRSRGRLGVLAFTVIAVLNSVDSASAESLTDTVTSADGTSTSRSTAPGTDWRNTTYTVPCGGQSTRPVTVKVRHGEGRAPGDSRSPSGYFIYVSTVTRGDLTRDGHPETVVLIHCGLWLANYSLPDVLVFTNGRRLLGHLPALAPVPGGSSSPEYMREFGVSRGRLFTGVGYYAPGDCHVCGPSLYATLAWHWDGRRFATRTPVGASR